MYFFFGNILLFWVSLTQKNGFQKILIGLITNNVELIFVQSL